MVTLLSVSPSVASYALVSTGFRSADAAILFITERDAESGLMQHPFVAYQPNEVLDSRPDEDTSNDLESPLIFNQLTTELCYICQNEKGVHASGQ